MTPGPLPPDKASAEELRAYYRAVADAAMATVVAGPPLPTQKPKPSSQGPSPISGQEDSR